ncbi:hypothetical protein BKA69DRAFT_167627 [Paraphysoderma sedebokerense]|nr:hypothetical protein BKA69DRAFT_167627 [Paraphysoderma sedebokerense]
MFDCSKELDGQYWMDAQPDSLCYQGWWLNYANLAYVALAIYVIGIPFYFCILIFLYYQNFFLGGRWMEAREYAERILNVRKSYFKVTHQYFIVIQLLRKLSIVFVKVFFTRYLILQAVLSSVILSIDAVLSAKYLPYVLKSLNALEVICTLSAIIIMNGALLIHTDQFERGTAQRDIAAGIIASLIIGCVTVLIIMVIKEIVVRIRKWQEADKNSHIFDESILASAQIGGSISRRKLKDTTYLRKVLEQAVVATEESTN